ncbi:MAG: helix-turn-helix domain-containing protein [Erysipelotrichaceae bacterium]|nr:helix-turn-helix domain-containing protein [Erysipelotrichaceae bacterium]
MYAKIKALRLKKGISQDELAEKVGYTHRSSIGKVESGLVDISQSKIQAFANALGTTPQYLMGFEEDNIHSLTGLELDTSTLDESTYKLPVIGYVRGGEPNLALQEIIDTIDVPKKYANKDYFALKIKGDSMSPRILENDVVIVQKMPNCNDNDVCIVMVNGNEATCKQVKISDTGITLLSFNPSYAPMYYSNKEIEELPIYILGKVVELRGVI